MTMIMHGTWLPQVQCLFVWGEDARSFARAVRKARVPAHPFQAAVADLQRVIVQLVPQAEPAEQEQIIWLPTVAGRPAPLRELRNAGIEMPEGDASLVAWRVRGLALDAQSAIEVLLKLEETNAPGSDLLAWQVAARLVVELVVGEQFLPALVRDGSLLRAHWKPRPLASTARSLTHLANALPPLCRAVVVEHTRAMSAQALLDDYIGACVDRLVRDLASEQDATVAAIGRWQRQIGTAGAAWLAALFGEDRLVDLRGREADELFRAWQNWFEQDHVAGDEQFRITFRLEAPGSEQPDQSDWTLRYLLQATDDPSLLVPASQLWQERGAMFHYLDRRFSQPQERLLRGLGFAARLVAGVERSLHTRTPEYATLSTEEAFGFLNEAGSLLEQSGFGVLVPAFWGGTSQLRLRASARKRTSKRADGPGRLSLASMINFNWQLSIGDQQIELAEFERLVALKQPLVQIRGEWVALDLEQARRAMVLLKKGSDMSLGEALRLGLAGIGPQIPAGLAFVGFDADSEISTLLGELSQAQQLTELPQPSEFQGVLRPYQLRGFSWLAFLRRFHLGACLADDMGLGKCLVGSSLIYVNGTLRSAEQLWEQFAGPTTFDGEGFWAEPSASLQINAIDEATGAIIGAPVLRLYRQRVNESLHRVRLEDGSSLTITRRHQLLTNRGWTNTLAPGDYVCVPARLTWQGSPADLDLIKLLAWQIAEGYEERQSAQVTITQNDQLLLEDLLVTLKAIGKRFNLKLNMPAIYKYAYKASYLRWTSRAYQHFLAEHGYQWGNRSAEKSIPDLVMQANDEGVRTFLRNYFDAEGTVIMGMASIEISSASALLMQQLVVLLRRLGIWMRVSQKRKRATNGAGIYRTCQIGVIGGNSARRFLREVGFGIAAKQQHLEQICTNTANTNDEYRRKPASRWTAKTLQAFGQFDREELSASRGQIQHLLDQEVYFCRIKSVEEYMHEGWVYDLEVAEHHNFVANNILCHNTAQTIALLLYEKAHAPDSGPTLLVCPTSVVGNWQRELLRFAPSLRVLIHQGPDRTHGAEFSQSLSQYDVVITSFPLLARDREDLSGIEWRLAILDEAQNIKNSDTRQAQAARALQAEARIALTGTPVENRLTELWSIMAFLNPGYLGGETEFRRTFAKPIEMTHDLHASDTLRQLTAPFILRRLKTDTSIINDLPDKIEMKVYVPLSREQATLYEATVRDALAQIEQRSSGDEPARRRGMVLAMLMKLKQICNHPVNFLKDGSPINNRSGKLERMGEMVEELLAAGDRALIFTQFTEMGTLLEQYLAERFYTQPIFLHGGTPPKERDAMVHRFQALKGPPLFILSLKAGGVGLNLTHANHVFHYDRWWNPAVEDQATDRAFRIGQQRNVQVHKFLCGGTVEEKIDDMIESKRGLSGLVLGSGETWLTELTTNQLRELVALRHDAVAE